MNNKNDEIVKKLIDKSLNAPKKAFNPIKKVVITVSTVMSISVLFTACSSLLNDTYNNGTPTKTEVLEEAKEEAEEKDEYRKFDYLYVRNRMGIYGDAIKRKFRENGIEIYLFKNLTVEDFEKVKDLITNIDLLVIFYQSSFNYDVLNDAVKGMGYIDFEDYLSKNNYKDEQDWQEKTFQEFYDKLTGQTPPSEKVE